MLAYGEQLTTQITCMMQSMIKAFYHFAGTFELGKQD